MHPLLSLLANRPQLLIDHAHAYAALFSQEFGLAYAAWRTRAMLQTVALCCLGVATALGGGALMLWAVTPGGLIHAPWVLWTVPLLPLAMAMACLQLARQQNLGQDFLNLSRQINADLAMLRELNVP